MIFVTILIVISALLLVLVVLAQNPKGGGANQFAGGTSQLIGVKKTGDLLEKLTWGFAIAIVVLSIVANLMVRPEKVEEPENNETTEQPAGNAPAPAQGQ